MDFVFSVDRSLKKIFKCKKIDKYSNLTRELKQLICMGDDDSNCTWYAWNGP